MLEALKNWWNRDKIERQAYLDEMKRYSEALSVEREQRTILEQQRAELISETVKLETQLETVKEEVGVFRQQAAEDEARRNGPEPWVEIKSESVDPVKGIQIELDWNGAFIQYLKEAGLKGRDEETIVQKWIAFLYQDLIEKLEKQVIDNSDKPRVNDFE